MIIYDCNSAATGLQSLTMAKPISRYILNDSILASTNPNLQIHLPCEYNNNVCGLLGNADNDPSNDNVMPNGVAAESHNQLGELTYFISIVLLKHSSSFFVF